MTSREGGGRLWPRVRVVSLSRAGVAHQNFRRWCMRWWQSVVCGECGVWRVSVCKISFSWGKFQQQQRSGNKHTVSRGQFVCGRSGLLTMGTMLHGRGSAVLATRGQTGHTCARDRALTDLVKLLVNSVQTHRSPAASKVGVVRRAGPRSPAALISARYSPRRRSPRASVSGR